MINHIRKDGNPKRYKYYNSLLTVLRKLEPSLKKARTQAHMIQILRKGLRKYDGGTVVSTYVHDKFHMDYIPSQHALVYNTNSKKHSLVSLHEAKGIILYAIKYEKHVASNRRWEARSAKNHKRQRMSRLQSYAKLSLTHPSSQKMADWYQKLIDNRKNQLKNS